MKLYLISEYQLETWADILDDLIMHGVQEMSVIEAYSIIEDEIERREASQGVSPKAEC